MIEIPVGRLKFDNKKGIEVSEHYTSGGYCLVKRKPKTPNRTKMFGDPCDTVEELAEALGKKGIALKVLPFEATPQMLFDSKGECRLPYDEYFGEDGKVKPDVLSVVNSGNYTKNSEAKRFLKYTNRKDWVVAFSEPKEDFVYA